MKPTHTFQLLVAAISAVFVAAIFYFRTFPTSIIYCVAAIGSIAAALENILFKNDLIRDKYTTPAIAFGIVGSALVPSLQAEETILYGALSSAFWAFFTYGILNLFVDLESRFTGPRIIDLDQPVPFKWIRFSGTPMLFIGSELFQWSDFFSRGRDELRIESDSGSIDSVPLGSAELIFKQDKLFIGGRRYLLAEVNEIRGFSSHYSFPKVALGPGIIKALAAFAAIFGWRGALFIFIGSAVISTVLRFPLIRRTVASETVPLMPFLAVSALIWMLFGPELISAYFVAINE